MLPDDSLFLRAGIALPFDDSRARHAIEPRPIERHAANEPDLGWPLTNGSSPLLFVHVPKTAGSSLYSVFRTMLKPAELLKLHPGGETLLRISRLPKRHVMRLRVLYGHVDVQLARQLVPLQQCVTLLRDPVDRMVSYYAFARYMDSGRHSELARRSSITEWMEALRLPEMDNGMVRRFSGTGQGVGFGACTRQMLERAKANLAQFALVGLTDRFDEFYALLASQIGLPMRSYVAAKVNAQRPLVDELSGYARARLEERNELDRELYCFGEQLFAGRLSGSDLSAQIDEFRSRCADRSLRIRDAARRIAFAHWKKLRRHWSSYPFLG